MPIRQKNREDDHDVFDDENTEFVTLEEAGLEENHNQPTFDISTPHVFMDFMYDGEEEWSFAE